MRKFKIYLSAQFQKDLRKLKTYKKKIDKKIGEIEISGPNPRDMYKGRKNYGLFHFRAGPLRVVYASCGHVIRKNEKEFNDHRKMGDLRYKACKHPLAKLCNFNCIETNERNIILLTIISHPEQDKRLSR